MRSDGAHGGRCPIADDAPVLHAENEIIVQAYRRALFTSERVESGRKVFRYVRPADVIALLDIHGAPHDDRARIMSGVILLETIENKNRPSVRAPKHPRGRM